MANVTTLIRLREAVSSQLYTSSFGSSASSLLTSSSLTSTFVASSFPSSLLFQQYQQQQCRTMGTLNGGRVPYSKRVIRSKRKFLFIPFIYR